jgi:hypothetical protein
MSTRSLPATESTRSLYATHHSLALRDDTHRSFSATTDPRSLPMAVDSCYLSTTTLSATSNSLALRDEPLARSPRRRSPSRSLQRRRLTRTPQRAPRALPATTGTRSLSSPTLSAATSRSPRITTCSRPATKQLICALQLTTRYRSATTTLCDDQLARSLRRQALTRSSRRLALACSPRQRTLALSATSN